jgi:hypothetical protein
MVQKKRSHVRYGMPLFSNLSKTKILFLIQ